MNQFANALGKKFVESKDEIRTRTFELGGHIFKVRVPLTIETEAIQKRLAEIDEAKVEEYYQDLTKDLLAHKDTMPQDSDIKVEYLENDVLIDGRSMRESAKNKVSSEMRIVEMFRLLVPEDKSFDMSTLTYKDIEEIFPLPVQMTLLEEITNVISFDYKKIRGK